MCITARPVYRRGGKTRFVTITHVQGSDEVMEQKNHLALIHIQPLHCLFITMSNYPPELTDLVTQPCSICSDHSTHIMTHALCSEHFEMVGGEIVKKTLRKGFGNVYSGWV